MAINVKENQTTKQEKYFLYACFVMPDGVGDLGHFIDIAKQHGKDDGLENYKPLYIVQYDNPQHKDQIMNALKDKGFDITSKQFHLIGPDKNSYDYRETFENYLDKNTVLQEQLLATPAMLNISSRYFNLNTPSHFVCSKSIRHFLNENNKKMACISISEHQGYSNFQGYLGDDTQLIKHKFLGIGPLFKTKHIGLLLNKLKISDKDKPSLNDLNNKIFLSALINKISKDPTLETKDKLDFDQKTFLEQSLIIPCYFNNDPKIVLESINISVNAPITNSYKEYVFVLNKGNTYQNIDSYLKKLSPQIKFLQLTTKVNDKIVEKRIENPNFDPKGKQATVRILEGFWLNDHDYNILYQHAQLFSGLSGDKSLERVLSYDLIPLAQIRPYKYELYYNLATLAEGYLQKILKPDQTDLVSLYLKAFLEQKFAEAAKYLKPEFLQQWQIFSDYLSHNYNAYHELPKIKKQCLMLAAELKAGVEQKLT